MTRIALVVSDVDGTLLTKDKVLTDGAKAAVRKLHEAGIGFTIVSSRPTIGMGFLIEPLSITLPLGAFNGSSIVDRKLRPIEQHLIPPAVAQRSLDVLNAFGVDIWLFTNERWLHAQSATANTSRTRSGRSSTIRPSSTDFTPHLTEACKIVGASSDSALLQRCEAAMKEAVGARPPPFVRRPIISTSRRRVMTRVPLSPRCRSGLAFPTDAIATIGDMENDLPMFARSGISFAMGNAADDIKQHATHVTDSNEHDGFAAAIETVLQLG